MTGVRKTKKGIMVVYRSGDTYKTAYYRDGSYPSMPDNPDEEINDYGITAEMLWRREMKNCQPMRIYDYF